LVEGPFEITILNLPASIRLTTGESPIYIIEGNEKKGVIEKLFVSSYKKKTVIKNTQIENESVVFIVGFPV